MIEFLTSQAALTIIGGLFTVIWGVFKMEERLTTFFQKRMGERRAKMIMALAAAAQDVYDGYVRDLKKYKNEDGQLTKEEAGRAKKTAIARAVALASREGIDLVQEMGEEYINLWLERIIKEMKRKSHIKDVGLSGLLDIIGMTPEDQASLNSALS